MQLDAVPQDEDGEDRGGFGFGEAAAYARARTYSVGSQFRE